MTIPKQGNKVSNDERIAVLETTCNHILEALIRIDTNVSYFQNRVESKFSLLDSKIDAGLKDINNRLWTLFFWTGAIFAGMLGVMAHGFGWV